MVLDMDCRGLEFVDFKADVRFFSVTYCMFCINRYNQGEWEAEGTDSSTPFTAIDLSEGEWYDYDEKAGDEVSIKEIGWEIKRS